ncbi:hypothetical protein JQ557_26255 [Bradyrhizobium sp. U87765 SZCCT0131]|nr:hypothetical protein [Bradyrhizobium sp. U87765 SZCCT0131]MBR1264548.1 hypothetical protein [Bradyrhizobium sp. U87765 SZCCT0134]
MRDDVSIRARCRAPSRKSDKPTTPAPPTRSLFSLEGDPDNFITRRPAAGAASNGISTASKTANDAATPMLGEPMPHHRA